MHVEPPVAFERPQIRARTIAGFMTPRVVLVVSRFGEAQTPVSTEALIYFAQLGPLRDVRCNPPCRGHAAWCGFTHAVPGNI